MGITVAKTLLDSQTILVYLKKGNAACNQKQIRDGTSLAQCYVSRALTYLVRNGKVIQSERKEQRGKQMATIKYYAAAGDDRPASSVMVK